MSEKEQFSEVSKEELKLRRAKLRKQASRFRITMWLIAAISLILMGVALYFYRTSFPGTLSTEHERWGTFGDFLGGALNPIFALFSFMALLWTIKQQNETILLSADELELTRQELEGSKKAQEDMAEAATLSANVAKQQSEMLKLQQFESTFYSLLEQHNTSYRNTETIFKGFDLSNKVGGIETKKNDILSDKNISQYMRLLYQLLKYVCINHPNNETKLFSHDHLKEKVEENEKRYTSIVRACISSEVIKLIAINGYCKQHENDEFYEYYLLLERYEFLEHIDIDTESIDKNLQVIATGGISNQRFYIEMLMSYNRAFGKNGKRNLDAKLVKWCNRKDLSDGLRSGLRDYILGRYKQENFEGTIYRESFFAEWYKEFGCLLTDPLMKTSFPIDE